MRVNKVYLCFIICLFIFSTSVNAQNTGLVRQQKDSILKDITNIDRQLKKISTRDTTKGFSAPLRIDSAYAKGLNASNLQPLRDEKGLLILKNDWMPFDDHVSFRDTVIFDPVFLPVVFDGKILPSDMDFLSKKSENDTTSEFHLISPDSTFAPKLARVKEIEAERRQYYMNNPQRVKLNAFHFKDIPLLKETIVEKKSIFQDLLTTDDPIGINKPEVEKIRIKPVYWIKTGEHSLQINQNELSDNWYNGGNSNFSIINYHKLNVKYKKNKTSFENSFEWRLNVQRTPADKFHKISIIEDYVRNSSLFGITAFKKWSYNVNLKIETPIFRGYPVNSESRVRSLFSPLVVNSGIGMRYTTENISPKDKYKRLNLSLELSPASINYTLVADTMVDKSRYGVDEGKKSKLDLGSTVKADISYSFNRYNKFTSRIMYFTNYEKILFECENKYTMNLNRFLSTSIYFYLRYDDGVPPTKKGDWGYFQYNEMVGFGLTYTW